VSDIRPFGRDLESAVKCVAWYFICQAAWRIESMKRLLFVAVLLVIFVLPAYAEGPDWDADTPPSGDFATKEITYLQPAVTTGKAWFFTHGNVVPCGVNGGYPGDHTIYVDTYDPDLFPSDKASAANVPSPGVKVAYWCSGESNPSPQNQHWALLPTWRDGLDDPTRHGVDFPLYAQNTCKVAVYNGDSYPSAIVSNIHTRHADDTKCAERDRNYGHWSYVLQFVLVDLDAQATPTSTATLAPTNTPRPTPTPVPTWTPVVTGTPTLPEIRDAAWAKVGVEYNPEAAFSTYARAHDLGAPLANEFDLRGYRIQPFMGGVVYARIGDWQNTKHLTY
jgi:hypothetical protein